MAKSRSRKVIEGWTVGKKVQPHYLDGGQVFITPSSSEPLPAYHVVSLLKDRKTRKEYWLCSCKGFRFSPNDTCRHVNQIKEQLDELRQER